MKQKRWTLVLLAALLTALAAAAGAETLDEYFTCRFSWSPAVYTGPGGTYFRAGNGKAQYGSPGQARVYGTENGWLLIGYQTGGGQYRLGYIDGEKALERMYGAPEGAAVRDLTFAYEETALISDCTLTDDPVLSKSGIDSLKAGDRCWYLAQMSDRWAYVEVRTGSAWKRGFVPLDAVDVPREPPLRTVQPTAVPTALPWEYSYPTDTPYPADETPAPFAGVWAVASQRLATRAGPSAAYPETGTYFLQNQMVLVLARHYDESTYVWWVKCRIEYQGTSREVWTGVKRFYSQEWLLDQLPDE